MQIVTVILSLSVLHILVGGFRCYLPKTTSLILPSRPTYHSSLSHYVKRRSRESLLASTNGVVVDNGLLAQIRNGAGSRSALSYDYMGMINFCLEPSDSGLSGPSTTKLLNEITNEVFRVIMIGFEPAFKETLTRYNVY
jgi:hypothetical protein